MTVITQDVQTLDPGALVELFSVDATSLGGGFLFFHGYTQAGTITWAGQAYSPWPIQAHGFARTSERPSQPTLDVGNIDGTIGSLCLLYDDLVGAKLTRRRTLGKYLDAVNFGGVNPTADPTQEMPQEIWYIERKAGESSVAVQFELSSAMDFNGVALPRRQIVANQCPWKYRSAECGYAGGAVADANDVPTGILANDVCGKRLSSCKLRFGASNQLNFGGFPAAGLMRT